MSSLTKPYNASDLSLTLSLNKWKENSETIKCYNIYSQYFIWNTIFKTKLILQALTLKNRSIYTVMYVGLQSKHWGVVKMKVIAFNDETENLKIIRVLCNLYWNKALILQVNFIGLVFNKFMYCTLKFDNNI